MSHSQEQSFEGLNVPLLRRVAETLLAHDPDAHRGLNIQTRGDEVILRGVIVGEETRNAAVQLVRSIVGVSAVVDRLTVRSRPMKPTALTVPVTVAIEREPWWQRAATPLAVFSLVGALVFWQYSRLSAETAVRLPTLPVEGSAYVDGVPAAGAELVFHPLDVADASVGKPRAEVGSDGRFLLRTYSTDDGAPAGHYVVTVHWRPTAEHGATPSTNGNLVAEQFTSPRTTPLFVEIAPGETPIVLDSFHLARAVNNSRKTL